MIYNLEDALYVANYILNDDNVRQRFEDLCKERSIDKDFLKLTAKVHIYGMARNAIKHQDDRSLSKCCRYILSNHDHRKSFKKYLHEKFGKEPIPVYMIIQCDHIFARALMGLGSDPLLHFPYLFVDVCDLEKKQTIGKRRVD